MRRRNLSVDDIIEYVIWGVGVVGTLYFGAHFLSYLLN